MGSACPHFISGEAEAQRTHRGSGGWPMSVWPPTSRAPSILQTFLSQELTRVPGPKTHKGLLVFLPTDKCMWHRAHPHRKHTHGTSVHQVHTHTLTGTQALGQWPSTWDAHWLGEL